MEALLHGVHILPPKASNVASSWFGVRKIPEEALKNLNHLKDWTRIWEATITRVSLFNPSASLPTTSRAVQNV